MEAASVSKITTDAFNSHRVDIIEFALSALLTRPFDSQR